MRRCQLCLAEHQPGQAPGPTSEARGSSQHWTPCLTISQPCASCSRPRGGSGGGGPRPWRGRQARCPPAGRGCLCGARTCGEWVRGQRPTVGWGGATYNTVLSTAGWRHVRHGPEHGGAPEVGGRRAAGGGRRGILAGKPWSPMPTPHFQLAGPSSARRVSGCTRAGCSSFRA